MNTEIEQDKSVATAQQKESPLPSSAQIKTDDGTNTKNIKIFVGIVFIIVVVVGGMYYMGPKIASPKSVVPVATTQVDPGTVRAVVNGEEITQEVLNTRLQEAAQVLLTQGLDLNNPAVRTQVESQVLDDTINYILLKQNAASAGIQVEQSTVDLAYEEYVVQSGGEEQLIAQLQQIGLTTDEFKSRLEEQLVLDTFIEKNVNLSEIVVTDEEIQIFYDNAVAVAGDDAPALADVRLQIVEQLTNKKKQERVNAFTNSLRKDADIEIK